MKFTEEHEWLRVEDDLVVVGITSHAAEQLGDVVFVELPEAGTTVSKDDEVVVIESVKAASDILAPVDGEIAEVNEALVDDPGKVNEDPEGDAWFFKLKIEDLSVLDELMDEAAYKKFVGLCRAPVVPGDGWHGCPKDEILPPSRPLRGTGVVGF